MRTDGAFDGFARAVLIAVCAALAVFVAMPLVRSVLLPALAAWRTLFDAGIWSLACLRGAACGSGWHTLALGGASATLATLVGGALALLAQRGRPARSPIMRAALRGIAVLPSITPPFAVGLALILLLGRNGIVTREAADLLGLAPGRWLYGAPGIVLAQCLAFAPLAYLTLRSVVARVPAPLEEAAATLRASNWTILHTVTWPMLRPGVANAWLLCFIESVADFGDPLVVGGNFRVLSTDLYFAVVGAEQNAARAAVLAVWLLAIALAAFMLQRAWLGRARYASVSGKPVAAQVMPLGKRVQGALALVCAPWCVLALAVYATLLIGGFVRLWGVDFTLTTEHFADVLGVAIDAGRLVWSGSAWDAVWETLRLAALAAPLTAAAALLAGWLLARRRFAGRGLLDAAFAVSLAVPGTVMGLAWARAFDAPPLMLAGGASILVLSFVLRNMPLGLRAISAAFAQIDPVLDEASASLRAGSWTTLRRVHLPLLLPAIGAALIHGFVRAATTVSAVIFLVSADHDLATTYLMGLVSNGNDGPALALAGALVVVLCALLGVAQALARAARTSRRFTPARHRRHARLTTESFS
ncbi:iron ABC transporter permease [Paraburkholderia sp. Ac-20340]|uniref:ABC transporter permease n=1 Tax=Paraburkholderia sp. Ac-20340 TaxID=2703888 RepID=UPI00197D4A83|nr:iron ABC transporter permease [Paraburkholderia sp. Ac-20340]MBN3855029.1 iron ABC transporter permease [Paraburkholderia sp. Ac-20340]